MSEVLQHDIEEWPDDPYWQQKLPHWLLETFSKYSQQELTKIRSTPARWTDLDWTLGSWLDSMRDRDWRWWSLEQTASGYTLNVTIEGHPYFRSVLEHLIVAAGGILQDETNEESTGD